MNRFASLTLLLTWSWVIMTLAHESGHLLAGSLCGGSLSRVQLRPWSLPYSFFKPDPWPSVTLWAGPILGCLGPVVAASIWRRPGLWLIAWFCVLANGTYLLMGWYAGDG
ncbi:MAG: hypothetical protein HKN47_12230, partial [Pirellulaceae bacterium]|nr:hypothetical protein [Pirellulaceae bacterium]